MSETKPRQTKTPRNYDSIEKGALALKLEDLVTLRSKIDAAISAELNARKELWEQASKLVNGKE